jgi:general secretion pathway protein M
MKLARREKYLVSLAGGVVFLIVIHSLLIGPFFNEKERLRNGVKAKEVALEKIVLQSAEYKALKNGNQGLHKLLAKRKKGFTLFSFLEQEAAQSDIKGHIKYMKPSSSQGTGPYKESTVEMKLEEVTLKQLVGYLYRIESPEEAISIKRISIKENKKKPGYINAVLKVLTLQ